MTVIKKLFSPSDKFEGIWPIKVYILKLFFFLMFAFVAKDTWAELIARRGSWDPEAAIAWSSIAAYTTLAGIGIFRTLKMLPIMLFMFFYKSIWLAFVAYPLWRDGTLVSSDANGWAQIFIWIIIPMIFTPWKYIFNTYILNKKLV